MTYFNFSSAPYLYYNAQHLDYASFISGQNPSSVSFMDNQVSTTSRIVFEQSDPRVKPLEKSNILERVFCSSKEVKRGEELLVIRQNQPQFKISAYLLGSFNKLRLEQRDIPQLEKIWHDLRFFVVPEFGIKNGEKYLRILSSFLKGRNREISFYTCENYDSEFLSMNTRPFDSEGSASRIQEILNKAIKESFGIDKSIGSLTPSFSQQSFALQPMTQAPQVYPRNETLGKPPETPKPMRPKKKKQKRPQITPSLAVSSMFGVATPAIISHFKRQKVSLLNSRSVSSSPSSDSSSHTTEEDDLKAGESALSISQMPWGVKDEDLGIISNRAS